MRRKHQRHQQLRRRALQPHRHHHDDRQQRGHRAIETDEARQQRTQQHDEHELPDPALAGLGDEQLPGPRRHPGDLEPRADDEQRRDENRRGVAEPSQGLPEVQDAGEIQRQRGAERHQHDGYFLRHEEHDDGRRES